MDKASAASIISNTLEKPFDKAQFVLFVKNLLNRIDESKAFHAHSYVRESFTEYVKTYERIGTYTDLDGEKLDILIVYLQKETSLERARTAQRNFVARYLKDRDNKEAGLVAFVSPDPNDWRFSLVKMSYRLDEGTDGKTRVKTELSPARRWSFLVGSNESSHTAQTQLLPILMDDRRAPSLAQLESAFTIETVTREFFNKYRDLFLAVKDALDDLLSKHITIAQEFQSKNVDTANFARKLLGQIVFLYFLQKKGWFGVARDEQWGAGPKDFLRRLFDKKIVQYDDFFNDVLEPLFYDALATERTGDFYHQFNCKIPFLNGGLFDPLNGYRWDIVDIPLPDELFSNSEKTKEGDTGTGILDVFDRYNFTVKEDEPLEKEVAIDPEMLGKVFENLLEVKDRKSKGTYYTPREIVHYMCQESLINYLDTELNTGIVPLARTSPTQGKLLGTPDPEQMPLTTTGYRAAVPRKDIEDFIRHGEATVEHDAITAKKAQDIQQGIIKSSKYNKPQLRSSIASHAPLIDEKLASIRVCDPAIGSGAFPVGMMTEIVRARTALNTYVSEKTGRTLYDFKRHAIQNCLYGVDIDAGAVEIAKLRLWLSLVVDEEDIRQIKPLPNLDYKIVCGNSLLGVKRNMFNNELFQKLEALKPLYFNETSARKKTEYRQQINVIISKLTDDNRTFDFEVYFSEVFHEKGGFDVAIANPPYVRQEQLKALKPALQERYDCYSGVADLYVYFYECAFQILRDNGILTFISSNKYFRSGYGKKLRQFLSSKATVHQVIDFGDAPVFEAISYPSIIIASKAKSESTQTEVFTWKQGPQIEEFASVVASGRYPIAQSELTADGWHLESPAELRLLEKLRKSGKPLGEYVNGRFYRGILTGFNEAFVINRATRDQLIAEHPSSAEILKPFLRGRDVKRWKADFAEQYLIKIESSENKQHPWSGKPEKEAEKTFTEIYPAIYAHLGEFRENLIKREDQGNYFWELRSCKYWKEFEQPKIVWGNLAVEPKFAFAEKGFYINAPANIIVSDSKYLLGILNSRITHYLVSQNAAERQGGFLEYKPMYISPLAIPEQPDKEEISTLVDHILSLTDDENYLTNTAKQTKVKEYEREIDQLVYRLYRLTPEEIAIIEGSGK